MAKESATAASMGIILVVDAGSTTSKARLFGRVSDSYRYLGSGEASTTVEAPVEDVTIGVRNAITDLERATGRRLMAGNRLVIPSECGEGVDMFIATCSAGGGLQMIVLGLIPRISAKSAERAALGAGAIVMDVFAHDDGRTENERIESLYLLRPDMILLTGGFDGGAVNELEYLARELSLARPPPRQGAGFKVPVVFAGNKEAMPLMSEILGKEFALTGVENIRPTLEIENLGPTQKMIQNLFMEHVMAHAPGYSKLADLVSIPIMPTPMAEGHMFQVLAASSGGNVLGVGLGGATTNIYSVYNGQFVRTVSANLGMSYSIHNVLTAAKPENVSRWLPFQIQPGDLLNSVRNKALHPTIVPQTLRELIIEHAIARESIRLAFAAHQSMTVTPVPRYLDITNWANHGRWSDTLLPKEEKSYLDMKRIQWIVGTGGLLSHSPRRSQAALILLDAFQPFGVTGLAQDSVFMIPHLGILSTVNDKAAVEIFHRDCLVRLGTCIAFAGKGEEGSIVGTITMRLPDGSTIRKDVTYGELSRVSLGSGAISEVEISPSSGFDAGKGRGRGLKTNVEGGEIGVLIDARGRPLQLSEDDDKRRGMLLKWYKELDAYPTNTDLEKGD
jgi:uncharacterized protein (TIGR01319 family)